MWEIFVSLVGIIFASLGKIDLLGLMANMNEWVAFGVRFLVGVIGASILVGMVELGKIFMVRKGWLEDKSPRVELHQEQPNEIKPLQFVQANLEKDVFPYEPSQKVGISIRNPLPQKITRLHVELIDVLWTESSGARSLKPDGFPNHRFTDIESNESGSIMSGETVRVNIATVNPLGKLILIPDERDNRKELAQRVYLWGQQQVTSDFKMQVEITGYANNKPIRREIFDAFIHFEGSHLMTATQMSTNAPISWSTEPVITIKKDADEEVNQKANPAR